MSKDERKEMIESLAIQFTEMEDVDKSYIAGYMVGKQEERSRLEKRLHSENDESTETKSNQVVA